MSSRPNGGFTLVEVTNARVLEAVARIDAMGDEEVRELVRGEPPIIVEAGGGHWFEPGIAHSGSRRGFGYRRHRVSAPEQWGCV